MSVWLVHVVLLLWCGEGGWLVCSDVHVMWVDVGHCEAYEE